MGMYQQQLADGWEITPILVPFCNLAHLPQQFGHTQDAVPDGINLGLRDALEILRLPFNDRREFSPEFEHEPILPRAGEARRSELQCFGDSDRLERDFRTPTIWRAYGSALGTHAGTSSQAR